MRLNVCAETVDFMRKNRTFQHIFAGFWRPLRDPTPSVKLDSRRGPYGGLNVTQPSGRPAAAPNLAWRMRVVTRPLLAVPAASAANCCAEKQTAQTGLPVSRTIRALPVTTLAGLPQASFMTDAHPSRAGIDKTHGHRSEIDATAGPAIRRQKTAPLLERKGCPGRPGRGGLTCKRRSGERLVRRPRQPEVTGKPTIPKSCRGYSSISYGFRTSFAAV
jgi:hypothetical protein